MFDADGAAAQEAVQPTSISTLQVTVVTSSGKLMNVEVTTERFGTSDNMFSALGDAFRAAALAVAITEQLDRMHRTSLGMYCYERNVYTHTFLGVVPCFPKERPVQHAGAPK